MITKDCLISFWLSILMSVFLFYRNKNYDRILAVYIAFLGFSDLILYGYHNNSNKQQSAKWLLITYILQSLMLSLIIYFKTTNTVQRIAGYLLIINMFLLISGLFYVNSDNTFSIENDLILINEKPINGSLKFLYILLISSSLILINFQYNWKNVSLTAVLLLFLALCGYWYKSLFTSLPKMSVLFCLITWSNDIKFNSTDNNTAQSQQIN